MSEVGIVIVTWNSGREIGPCLDAALATGADVVVVDNASQDDTCREVARRGVRLIANSSNLGFAAAVNQGFRRLTNPFVLLLNPDAVIEQNLEALVRACGQPGAAAAGGKLLSASGDPQVGFMVRRFPTTAAMICELLGVNRIWPSNPVNWNYRCLGMDHAAPQEVEQPAGAFLMVRREVWETLAGFDEKYYPLWFEDVDFCRRAYDLGYHLYYHPQAVARHTGGHSIPKIPLENRRLYWYRSLLRYTVGHFRPANGCAICLAVVLGSFLRILAEAASGKPGAVRVYGQVMRLAWRTLWGAGRQGSHIR